MNNNHNIFPDLVIHDYYRPHVYWITWAFWLSFFIICFLFKNLALNILDTFTLGSNFLLNRSSYSGKTETSSPTPSSFTHSNKCFWVSCSIIHRGQGTSGQDGCHHSWFSLLPFYSSTGIQIWLPVHSFNLGRDNLASPYLYDLCGELWSACSSHC